MSERHISDSVLAEAKLLVCVGTGGVGKTTTSAALALRAAALGRRTLVLTIDPAKRLANAMGLESLGNEARAVELGSLAARGGSLSAMMLDAQRTFDELIIRTAGVHAERILKNRIYRIMVDQFAGTQEYMSLERLYDLYERGGYDLIVLDTPPSKNTLDFFDAPRKTAGLFDEQVMRWFVPNSGSESGFFQKLFNPGAAVLKLLSTIGGDKFVAELGEFFEALRVVRAEFKVRGDRVHEILRDGRTHYVVVASPDPRRVDEACYVWDRLAGTRMQIWMMVLNRSHDQFGAAGAAALARPEVAASLGPERLAHLSRAYAGLASLGLRDRAGIDLLMSKAGKTPVLTVPAKGRDIHTLKELLSMTDHLFGPLAST